MSLFFLCFCLSESAAQNDYFNSETFWKSLRWNIHPYVPHVGDTAIIIASDREVFDSTALRRIGEGRHRDGQINIYTVASRNGIWSIHPEPDLRGAMLRRSHSQQDWVIYAEGYGKIFTSGIDRGLRMSEQYGVNVLYLDYPSFNTRKSRIGNFFFSRRYARTAARDFAPVLDSLKAIRKETQPASRLTFFLHSMGNHLMREGILKKHFASINQEPWLDAVVLNAACIPQRGHKRWLDSLRMATSVYVHYNPQDYVLGGAHLLSFKKQLGEKVREPISPRAVYINFNSAIGNRHSNFATLLRHFPVTPACIDHYRLVLHGLRPDFSDTLRYRQSSYRGIGYDLKPLPLKDEGARTTRK